MNTTLSYHGLSRQITRSHITAAGLGTRDDDTSTTAESLKAILLNALHVQVNQETIASAHAATDTYVIADSPCVPGAASVKPQVRAEQTCAQRLRIEVDETVPDPGDEPVGDGEDGGE